MVHLLKNRPYTYLEILVVLAAILMIAGLFTINIRQAALEQRFESDVGELMGQVKLAQNLNALFGIDIEIQFKKINGELHSKMIPTGVITEGFDELLKKSDRVYNFNLQWEGRGFTKLEEFPLRFNDQGYNTPLGILTIEGYKTLYVAFPGYPIPLFPQSEIPSLANIEQRNMSLYDQLTPFVFQDPHVH